MLCDSIIHALPGRKASGINIAALQLCDPLKILTGVLNSISLRSGLPRQMDSQKLDDLLRPMLLPDLRIECRARGISPAGGRPALLERVREHMQQTGN